MDFSSWPIINVDGYFRYVNHDLKLVTTGFSVPGALERNADIIRHDPVSVETMSKRYRDMFNTDKDR